MANAIMIKQPGGGGGGSPAIDNWELIRDYTVDELTTGNFSINTDTNGNPFRLRKVIIGIVAKKHPEHNVSAFVRCAFGYADYIETALTYKQNFTTNSGMAVWDGSFFTTTQNPYDNAAWNNTTNHVGKRFYPNKLNKITTYIFVECNSYYIDAGSKFIIYGVRE